MGHNKVIINGDTVEIFQYERGLHENRGGRRKRETENITDLSHIPFDGQDAGEQHKQTRLRRESDARRTALAFRRVIRANLRGSENPIFASLTYGPNMDDVRQGREDFSVFAKRLKRTFGNSVRWVCVAEFQERGAVHFHSLIWGLPVDTVSTERSTRVVATLWGQGFVDLINTDGSNKLAGYMSKYLMKNFMDSRLAGRRLYTTSRNVVRPIIDSGALILPYYHGKHGVDLNTAVLINESDYDTQWLGKANYKRFELKKNV